MVVLEDLIESIPTFDNAFDPEKNTPHMSWDPACLVKTVGEMYEAMRNQKAIMTALKKELDHQKAEKEKLVEQFDVDTKAREEKYKQLMDAVNTAKLTHEQALEEVRKEQDERDKQVQDFVDNAVESFKNEGGGTQVKFDEMQKELDALKDKLTCKPRVMSQSNRGASLSDKHEYGERDSMSREDEGADVKVVAVDHREGWDEDEEEEEEMDLNEAVEKLSKKYNKLCRFIGITPKNVNKAIEDNNMKDAFLETPALDELANRIVNLGGSRSGSSEKRVSSGFSPNVVYDTLPAAAIRDLFAAGGDSIYQSLANGDVKGSIEKLLGMLNELREYVEKSESRIIQGYTDEDYRLRKRIDDLMALLIPEGSEEIADAEDAAAGGAEGTPIYSSGDKRNSRDATKMLSSICRDLEDRIKHLERLLNVQGDNSRRGESGTGAGVEKRQAAFATGERGVPGTYGGLGRPSVEVDSFGTIDARKGSGPGSGGGILGYDDNDNVDKKDVSVTNIYNRLGDLEGMSAQLHDIKADKADVNSALRDLMRRIEKALNDILERLIELEKAREQDATLGRFRCLSCNRSAGPLAENVPERISMPQLPPSSIGAQQQQLGAGSQSLLRGKSPSTNEKGSSSQSSPITNSRRKLNNYYGWLHSKSSDVSRSNQGGAGFQPQSPIARQRMSTDPNPWPGAQSGGGYPGERQCGDHGSAAPEAIGTDGKFYEGVKHSPSSRQGGNRPLVTKNYREACDAAKKQEAAVSAPTQPTPEKPSSA